MKVVEITEKDKDKFDRFVQDHPLGNIQQCRDWGAFQSRSGQRDKFHALCVEDEKGNIAASALVVRQKIPFGKSWLYCPRGPIIDYSKTEHLSLLFKKISAIARRENAVFFRFEPPLEAGPENPFKALKSQLAHARYQPESTLIVDLKHEPEDILKQMKPKGRYNIKVAQKHGVTVRISDGGGKDVKSFYQLLKQTTKRDKFSPHPQNYYQNMLAILGRKRARLYLAEYQGGVIAGMIATFFKDTATYYFGASANVERNVMAPYLLHWQVMRDAREAGYHYYDFFGISPENRPGHPWAKVTEFKLKFGGQRLNYFPAQEIVYQPFWYFMMKVSKWALKLLRRA